MIEVEDTEYSNHISLGTTVTAEDSTSRCKMQDDYDNAEDAVGEYGGTTCHSIL